MGVGWVVHVCGCGWFDGTENGKNALKTDLRFLKTELRFSFVKKTELNVQKTEASGKLE